MSRKAPELNKRLRSEGTSSPLATIVVLLIPGLTNASLFCLIFSDLKTPKDQSHRLAGKLKPSAGGGVRQVNQVSPKTPFFQDAQQILS